MAKRPRMKRIEIRRKILPGVQRLAGLAGAHNLTDYVNDVLVAAVAENAKGGERRDRMINSLRKIEGYLRSPGFATGSSDPATQGSWLADEISAAIDSGDGIPGGGQTDDGRPVFERDDVVADAERLVDGGGVDVLAMRREPR